MVSKRKIKRRDAKTALKLSRRAQTEAEQLLKGSRRGTITGVQLKTGLKELDTRLKRIMHLILKVL